MLTPEHEEALDFYASFAPLSQLELPYALLVGSCMISSPGVPGPFHRRQLHFATRIWGMRRDHSNAFQGALHRMRDRGFFENVGVGDYMATPRTFEWVEHHYGTLPQAWMPVPKEQFHWRAVGAVDNVEFELRYVRGEMSEALVGGTAFSSAVEARTALMREGVWQRAEMPSWNDAMAAFEARASGCGTWQARG